MGSWPAPAKINLALHITGRRDDGYHLLDSLVVFAPDAADRITVEAADKLSLTVTGPMATGVPTDDTNLVVRAARRLALLRNVACGGAITLEKNLPHGAGIGGGSSDAAAAIRALADLWGVAPLTPLEALPLGADVPVCLSAPTPKRMQGVGEILSDTPPLPPLWVVLVNPGRAVPTKTIFAELAEEEELFPAMDPIPANLDADAFALWLLEQRNDLTQAALPHAPEIAQVLAALWATEGYVDAEMSGSGSTCWALYETQEGADAAAQSLRDTFPDYWIAVSAVGTA